MFSQRSIRQRFLIQLIVASASLIFIFSSLLYFYIEKSIIDEKYQVSQIVSGKVVQIKEYGCFVELEPGLDGLVHISEVNHKRVANINDELSIGEEVSAKILENSGPITIPLVSAKFIFCIKSQHMRIRKNI